MSAANLTSRIFQRAEAMSLLGVLPQLAGLPHVRIQEINAGGSFSAAEFEQLCRALAVDPTAMFRG